MSKREITNQLTTAELQDEARLRGLASSGTKGELLDRIRGYDSDQGLHSPEAPEQALSDDALAQAQGKPGQETKF